MTAALVEQERKQSDQPPRYGDVIRIVWQGAIRRVNVLPCPCEENDSVDCDCDHWDEIIATLGDNNAF